MDKPGKWISFFRAQLVALLATAVDFGIVIFSTEILNIWYVFSNIIGAVGGTVISFLLGRYWAFVARERKMAHQAWRYLLVSFGSLSLNTLGLYLITEYGSINYVYSKLIVAVIIGIGFNFMLQKYFVFNR